MSGKGEPLKDFGDQVYCSHCKGKRNHKIIITHKEVADRHSEFHWFANYHIVKCSGCDKIAFLEQYGDEDTWDVVNGEREWVDLLKVYPEQPKEDSQDDLILERYKINVKRFKHAPDNIFNLYEQIVESFNSQHLILCTSGLRTLIEGICSHLVVEEGYIYDDNRNIISIDKGGGNKKSNSLGGRIFGLFENGHIVFPQALILQRVKIIGNSAIHDIISPEIEDVREIIIIIDEL